MKRLVCCASYKTLRKLWKNRKIGKCSDILFEKSLQYTIIAFVTTCEFIDII